MVGQVRDELGKDGLGLGQKLLTSKQQLSADGEDLSDSSSTSLLDLVPHSGEAEGVQDKVLDVTFAGASENLLQASDGLGDNGRSITDVVGQVRDELSQDGLSLGQKLLTSKQQLGAERNQLANSGSANLLDLVPDGAEAQTVDQEIGQISLARAGEHLLQVSDGLSDDGGSITIFLFIKV